MIETPNSAVNITTKAPPIKLWITAPHCCETAPPVRFVMPSPDAFVSAALTAMVQTIR